MLVYDHPRMTRLVRAASIGAAVAAVAGVAVSPAATTNLPTLYLSAPKVVRVNHPFRVRAYGETKPGRRAFIYVFIRKSGQCKTDSGPEAMSGSYPVFGQVITPVGPGTYSKQTPRSFFTKPHRSAKICGYLYEEQGVSRRVVLSVQSLAG
jgi:hypothetical protein